MLGGLTLVLGGARSGKSAWAVELGRRHVGEVVLIATAVAADDDLAERIERHRADRPDWPTVEEPLELEVALASVDDHAFVIIDCLTLWVSNLLWHGRADDEVTALATAAAGRAARRTGPTVAITNEVGLGIHPETALGRRYRDVLGRVNQAWAATAERNLLLVAGRAVRLHDPWEVIA